ncbi:hypothetical protein [Candidatus Phytoplasma australiense]|uniref:hypothetical protein n=1 Tax=Phytoplasma australiense TaxID=59748 RepID=UPI001F31DFF7|nr:hypothetical protein [Candidatus Phytoplasma australiense]
MFSKPDTSPSLVYVSKPKKFQNIPLTRQLAYLGLNQFIDGLDDNQFQSLYLTILQGDQEFFENDVLNCSLKTATTPLIQGTLDFLSQRLNQKFNLIINDCNSLSSVGLGRSVDLKMQNNSYHFFIKKSSDTLGDGYCFFHALIFVLREKGFILEYIINISFDKIDLVSNNQKIIKKIQKYKQI